MTYVRKRVIIQYDLYVDPAFAMKDEAIAEDVAHNVRHYLLHEEGEKDSVHVIIERAD